jgi:ribosome-binding ATPase YchF (GTP1/OBG family)
LEEIAPKVRMGSAEALRQRDLLKKLSDSLGTGKPAKAAPLSKEEWAELEDINLLTQKPVLYLANIGEDEARNNTPTGAWAKLEEYLSARGEMLVALAGKLEADLAELEEPERSQFAAEMGVEPAADKVLQACYKLLGLITFFTGVGAEVRSWPILAGSSAREAAGKIHTDIAKGFIRAEVIGFDELAAISSWETAREKGLVRLEGKDYILREGDVCYFRFSV